MQIQEEAVRNKREKMEKFIFPLLKCIHCSDQDTLQLRETEIHCVSCQRNYPIHEGIPIMMDDPQQAFDYTPDVIIANPYTSQWIDLIEKADDRPILDLGSGNNPDEYPHLIKMEIFAVPNAHVVAHAEKLPFKDNSIHTVMSGAVFEHLCNPFAASDELYRVIEMGGIVYIEVGFLVPVHAFPNHYFNMTKSGAEYLFSQFEKYDSGVRKHQYPSYTLAWILHAWASKMSPENQAEFLNSPVRVVMEEYQKDPHSLRWMDDFKPMDLEELAAGVYFYGSKTGDRTQPVQRFQKRKKAPALQIDQKQDIFRRLMLLGRRMPWIKKIPFIHWLKDKIRAYSQK